MRISILILCIWLPLFMYGQKVKLKSGKLWVDEKVYAQYEYNGSKKNNISPGYVDVVPENNPEVTGTDFHNVIFSLPNTPEQYIFAIAKVLASPHFVYLQYYYNIKFPLLGKELNIIYHPFLVEYFAKDIVKYGVFNDGDWNEDAAIKLYNAWSEKIPVIDNEKISSGKSINYNVSEMEPESEDKSMNISVKGNNIYLENSLIGTYRLSKKIKGVGVPGTMKGDYLYEIEDSSGNELALLRIPVLRSAVYLETDFNKKAIEIFTPERNEQKLIAIAAKVLILNKNIK